MKTITQEQINQITQYLENVIVPSVVGSNLIAISNILKNLPAVEDKTKTEKK